MIHEQYLSIYHEKNALIYWKGVDVNYLYLFERKIFIDI